MPEVGDDLTSGPDEEVGVRPLHLPPFVPVTIDDVFGDREEVELRVAGVLDEALVVGGLGVGVEPVHVEVAPVPPRIRVGDVGRIDRVGVDLGADRVIGAAQLDGPGGAGRRHLSEPQLDVPRAGLHGAGRERSLGGVRLHPRPGHPLIESTLAAPTPSAEPLG